ncbi:MAG: sigma-70 family RNA polymerase sigma factor, partial [Planctomycetota bacterium]
MNSSLKHDDFLRLLLKSEREIQRYVMAIVPHAADAQEIVQETAVALWKQIDKYDPSQPFTPWACRFAAIKAKEHLRKQSRWKSFLDEDVAAALLARREQTAPELDRRVVPLRDCLSKLSSTNRSLIEKYYFDQAQVEEIANQLDRSAAALYKSLQRIRAALMDCVNGKLTSPEVPS